MSKKVNILKSSFYISVLSILSFLGMVTFSNCKGKDKVTNNSQVQQNNKDTVIQQPVTKYGVPVNYKPEEQPARYGAPRENYKEIR